MEHFPLVDRLHQDVLEDKYGTISAKVLRHNNSIRESHLIDAKGISRTYALTFFPKKMAKKMKLIDKEIRSGKPIGTTFRKYGYAIRKNVIEAFILKLPSWLRSAFATKEKYAKARISEFYAKKRGSSPMIYGTVLEIYSPDFRPPVLNHIDIIQLNPSTDAFEKIGFTKDEIWKRIGRDNDWSDIEDSYIRARKNTLPLVFSLKKKIQNLLNKGK